MGLIKMCPECGKKYLFFAKFCSNCGCPMEAIDPGLEFTLSADGRSYSVKKYKGDSHNLVIPSAYRGKPVTEIGEKAFEDNSALTSVTIPDSMTSICYLAFYCCSGLTSVTIPDSVTNIGGRAFEYCSGLTEISVSSGNTKYHSAGNCLIETTTKTLVLGCKTSVIPDDGSVTSIGESAFWYCSGLTSILIPNSVTSIGRYAFNDCTDLTSVTIPNSVTSICDRAFKDCTALTEITFQGTEEEWNAIEKEYAWDENLGNGAYHINFVAEARKGFDDSDF